MIVFHIHCIMQSDNDRRICGVKWKDEVQYNTTQYTELSAAQRLHCKIMHNMPQFETRHYSSQ